MKELSLIDRAYLAGIIDGEGCISVRRAKPNKFEKSPRYFATVTVGNTSRPLIERLFEAFSGGSVTYRFATKTKKACWLWSVRSANALNVVRAVRPYLLVKREQADLLVKFVEGFESFKGGRRGRFGAPRISSAELERREALYLEMKALNKVGPRNGTPAAPYGRLSRGVTEEFRRPVGAPLLDLDRLDLVTDLDSAHDVDS